MRFLLTAKHWQVFIVLAMGLFLNNFVVEDNPTLTTIIEVIGYLTYFLWPMLVGHGLQDYFPKKLVLSETFFLINGFISVTAILAMMIISDGQGMSFSGVEALPMFYVFYAFLYYLFFPGRSLRTIENKRTADFGECIGDFFLVAFLPIGIWFLQPRINKIVDEQENGIEDQ
jgi:peptidoglycan/LPS O-acetylase OafA/YrhL